MQISTSLRIQNTSTQKSNTLKIQKSKNQKIQKSKKSKNPKIQKPKNPKIQHFLHLRNLVIFVFDFWIFRFLDFWNFCVLHWCFQSVETAPKLDSEKKGVCISIYSVFKGWACRRGAVTIYIYSRDSALVFVGRPWPARKSELSTGLSPPSSRCLPPGPSLVLIRYRESQWPIIWGYLVSITGYFWIL